MTTSLHGLIQKARIDASLSEYRSHPLSNGKGYTLWRKSPVGLIQVGMVASKEDAEDFLLSKLTQEDPAGLDTR